ncbi:MAG: hypothetical protein OZSIB_1522 [Candidatus Ozemobacter sibiricus]|jgi:hypothetical protein|uniref:Uncharacterized protein n=1 Tax=Candidatus Ozemobacter sibiricus TaxID=2268124 RepID=A0A367ZK55_9BACT|nr:MAG: hypothetical protein OZSIB_1522 [Candidatus Ozemobacter sibiricus]
MGRANDRPPQRLWLWSGLLGLWLAGVWPGLTEAGPLADKAATFDRALEEWHTPLGLVVGVKVGDDGRVEQVRAGGDATIWTGAWLAAQAFRYRATQAPQALANIEKGLRAFHILHAMSGSPGFLGRCFGPPDWFQGHREIRPGVGSYRHWWFIPDTSRDQYTGIFLAYATCLPLVRDPEVLDQSRQVMLAVGRNLQANDLALTVTLGSATFQPFNLNPDYVYQDRLTPHEWATVDDFPANLLAQAIPWNASLAAVLSTFRPPPIRGGEALRALMIVQTAAHFTGDPELQRFFAEDLVGRRRLPEIASVTSQLLGDLYDGRQRETLVAISRDLAVAFLRLGREAAIQFGWLPTPLADLAVAAGRPLAIGAGQFGGTLLVTGLRLLDGPDGFAFLQPWATCLATWANSLRGLGAARLAERLDRWAADLREMAGSNLDELADAQRSYVGTNLTFFALLGLFEGPTPPALRAAAVDIVARAFAPIADEGNTLYTFIRQVNGSQPLPAPLIAAAKATLQAYPLDQRNRCLDHRADPGVRRLPWPDRFGRRGNQADRPFPIDQRAPHVFIWQESPRALVTGHDDGFLVPPVGYLLAYWYGRAYGLLSPDD